MSLMGNAVVLMVERLSAKELEVGLRSQEPVVQFHRTDDYW